MRNAYHRTFLLFKSIRTCTCIEWKKEQFDDYVKIVLSEATEIVTGANCAERSFMAIILNGGGSYNAGWMIWNLFIIEFCTQYV